MFYRLAGKSVGQAEGSACVTAVSQRFAGLTTFQGDAVPLVHPLPKGSTFPLESRYWRLRRIFIKL